MPAGAIDDPQAILKWLAPDRAVVNLPTSQAFLQVRDPLIAVVRAWLKHVPVANAD